jgi:AcrR family transcriptional regulator
MTSTRARGRPPVDAGPAVTRTEIVQSATTELGRAGYAGLSLRGLARSLDVSLGTVQHHFATKSDLWQAVADTLAETNAPQAQGQESTDPPTQMTNRLRQLIDEAALRPGLTAALWHDRDPGAPERQAYLADRIRPGLEAARQGLEQAKTLGLTRDVDVEILLALISLGITSVASSPAALRRLFDIDLGDEQGRDRLAAGLADLLLNGVLDHAQPPTDQR